MISRRQMLLHGSALAIPAFAFPSRGCADEEVPRSVAALWAGYDPRREPLETQVIREWKEKGGVYRHVRYLIGTFKGQPARMAAIYGFPEGAAGKLPAVMHIHGGGQRASLSEVKLLVARGYAALSVNWGGSGSGKAPFNSVEGAEPGDPNTDWGAVDPSQLNARAYSTLLPGPKQLFEDREHPGNNNWYLLTIGCRRGLTFLEQQPEVDPGRLGVHGFSMGGNLTMYVAGTDDRVKAAVPAVGGQGWSWEAHEFLDGKARPQTAVQGDVELFRNTLSFESYAPRIRCPVLHRSSTNDFHGWMDDVYRTNALIPDQPLRFSWTPHLNHRLSPETAVTMPLWFDQHLKGGPALPETPASELTFSGDPVLRVVPAKHDWPVARCEVYYSIDPDPRARFWRSADVIQEGNRFVAKLPLHALEFPLFAFANVHHTLPKPESMAAIPGMGGTIGEVCLSSLLHTVAPGDLAKAKVTPSLSPGSLIDDFAHGLRDWYQLNAGHPSLIQTWTRKLTDPLHRGPAGAKLKLTLSLPQANRLTFVVVENEWRGERGPRRTFVCVREIAGGAEPQPVTLSLADFAGLTEKDGTLASWDHVDLFGICAHHEGSGIPASESKWAGGPAVFSRLEWI
jgi:dienelactone hydrolase